jgi:hypothetical protein
MNRPATAIDIAFRNFTTTPKTLEAAQVEALNLA